MAKNTLADWDTTAANNTDVGGISLAENVMRPPAVNNAFREVMAQGADLFNATVPFSGAQQGQARANIGGGVLSGFRNKVINGNFDIWQRGTSVATASGAYGPDRFLTILQSGISCTVTRTAFTTGLSYGKYHAAYAFTGTGAAGSSIRQRIEGVETLGGRTVTLAFVARASIAQNLSLTLRQDFGTGGSPSASVDTSLGTVALTTSFQEFKVTVSLPSISGKTLGSDGNDNLTVIILGGQANAHTIYIGCIELVEGDATDETTPLSSRHVQQELALCQRYYETSGAGAALEFSGNVTSAGVYYARMPFRVPKRAAATVVLTNAANTNFGATAGTPAGLIDGIGESRSATGTGVGRFATTWTADAEL